MNKDELKRVIDDLDDDAQIIIIDSIKEVNAVPREILRDCPQIRIKDRVLFLWRKSNIGNVLAVWSIAVFLMPGIVPTPPQIVDFAYETIKPLVENIDWSFPHRDNDSHFPYIAYEKQIEFDNPHIFETAKYVLPPSGFDSSLFTSVTGIQPS